MSISKRWINIPGNVESVLSRYRSIESPTLEQIAQEVGATYHTVHWICKNRMQPGEYKTLSAIRYSRSKAGDKNPMKGKTREQHHNWIGEVYDGRGYLTCLDTNGKRVFVHRMVMAKALGIDELPEYLDVHHIDGDRMDNELDNLALVTRKGHQQIHYLQRKDTESVVLKKSKLREALKYLISQ